MRTSTILGYRRPYEAAPIALDRIYCDILRRASSVLSTARGQMSQIRRSRQAVRTGNTTDTPGASGKGLIISGGSRPRR